MLLKHVKYYNITCLTHGRLYRKFQKHLLILHVNCIAGTLVIMYVICLHWYTWYNVT